MGRRFIEVSEATLHEAISQAEANGPLANRSVLYKAVADYINRPDVTPSVVMLRITQGYIPCTTPKGKRGRQKGVKIDHVNRTSRSQKLASPTNQEALAALRQSVPASYHGLVNRVAAGSIKAMTKLMCLQCVNFERKVEGNKKGEVIDLIGDCRIKTCALYTIRPFQKVGG